MNEDDGTEDIRWIRDLGGEWLPTAPYALLRNPEGLFLAIGEGLGISVDCFLHTRGQMCLYQTHGRRPPGVTGRVVNEHCDQRVGRSP